MYVFYFLIKDVKNRLYFNLFKCISCSNDVKNYVHYVVKLYFSLWKFIDVDKISVVYQTKYLIDIIAWSSG